MQSWLILFRREHGCQLIQNQIPFLSMIRIPLAVKRNLTKRFSVSTQKRCECKLGKKRRFVLLCAWETLFPDTGRFPVTWQILAMINLQNSYNYKDSLNILKVLEGRKAGDFSETSLPHQV